MPLRLSSMPSFVLATILSLLLVGTARAQDAWVDVEDRFTPEQRAAAGLDTLTPEQLATLNALLRADAEAKDAAARATLDAAQAGAAAARTAAASETMPAADRTRTGAPVAAIDDGERVGYDDRPQVGRVDRAVAGWQPGDEFRLDNGQVWKVLKGEMTLRTPLDRPQVRVVPGWAGRWFLEVDPDLPKARVYRID